MSAGGIATALPGCAEGLGFTGAHDPHLGRMSGGYNLKRETTIWEVLRRYSRQRIWTDLEDRARSSVYCFAASFRRAA